MHRSTYFWPGLVPLWKRGSWAGLAVAVGFTALADVLLLAGLVYRRWLSTEIQLAGWATLAGVWCVAWLVTRGEGRRLAADEQGTEDSKRGEVSQPSAEHDLLFRDAQRHYLAGDWVAAEQYLLKLLKQNVADVESRLMLATLWRHQGRTAEAGRQLDRIERLEAGAKWQFEIAAERQALKIQTDAQTLASNEPGVNTYSNPEQTPVENPKRRAA